MAGRGEDAHGLQKRECHLSLAPRHPVVSGPASVQSRSAWEISRSFPPDSDVVIYSQTI